MENLSCEVERVTFFDNDSNYAILRTKVKKEQVTVVGNFPFPSPGEILDLQGEWITHPKFGRQFKAIHSESTMPASAQAIRKYLGSGLVKGIGPAMANRIVDIFKEDTLEIIENNIERLKEVDGIGPVRIKKIQKTWDEQKAIRKVMVFLQGHDVSASYAFKIYKKYGDRSIVTVAENPYRLAHDIWGIGFKTADKIAYSMAVKKDSDIRIDAGLLYVLHELSNKGHVYYPEHLLVIEAAKTLEVDTAIISPGIERLREEGKIIVEWIESKKHNAVYLSKYHLCETMSAERLFNLLRHPKTVRKVDTEKAIDWFEGKSEFSLARQQRTAVAKAINEKVMVLTGGPGTGKTTIVKAILDIFSQLTKSILLAAPTGRAAKKMYEATGREAKTIHRLLEFNPKEGGFKHNENNPLICDLIVLDEFSMVDISLFHHLLKAIPKGATFIMVGDVDQLPSVGAGNVLKDIIKSGIISVVKLTEIFRQAQDSSIVTNAHMINRGQMPELTPSKDPDDFYFIQEEDPDRVLLRTIALVQKHIPDRFGFDPIDDIQVLSPMHRGVIGTGNLNRELQKYLNPINPEITRGGNIYRVGDKVMQIKNNYDKEVFNGDIGRIQAINEEEKEVAVIFEKQSVIYEYSDLDEIVLAYAASVHKSQGSEYSAVIIPVTTQHYMMLQRNLIYTGITRGRKLVVLVGTKKALSIAVNNDSIKKRYSLLNYRLNLLTQGGFNEQKRDCI